LRIGGSEIVIQNCFNVVLTVTIAFKWESQRILWMMIGVNFWFSNEWMMIKIRVYEHLISFKWEGQTYEWFDFVCWCWTAIQIWNELH